MEENTSALIDEEFGVDLSDVLEPETDDGNQTEEVEEQAEEQTGEENSEGNAEQTAEPEKSADNPDTKAEPELFEIKYLKDTRKVTREEMTELAQKGLNHDRIVQQRDALQQNLNEQAQWRSQNEGYLTQLEAMAKASGMDTPAFLEALRVNVLVQQGHSRGEAAEIVKRENAEAQLAKVNAERQKAQQEQSQQNQTKQRQEQDIQQFMKLHPGMDPKSIPASVWADVRNGDTLVNAYNRYETQQLQAENKRLQEALNAEKQNNKNKEKAIGSVKSSGTSKNQDDFLTGFDSI
jgi:hypothetical protein